MLWAGPIGNLLMNGGGNAALLARAVATSEGTTQGLSGIVRGSLILLDPRPSLDWTSKYSGGTPLGILLASGLFLGAVAVVDAPVVSYFDGLLSQEQIAADDLISSVHRIMGHADGVRRMAVRANLYRKCKPESCPCATFFRSSMGWWRGHTLRGTQ